MLHIERIRDLQLDKFKKTFKWAYERSKFHRSLYDRAGVRPEDMGSLEDIKRIPKVEKPMIRDIQRKEPFPYGDALCFLFEAEELDEAREGFPA